MATSALGQHCYCLLVHERPDCVLDLLRSLRAHDPDSAILLDNGGSDLQVLHRRYPSALVQRSNGGLQDLDLSIEPGRPAVLQASDVVATQVQIGGEPLMGARPAPDEIELLTRSTPGGRERGASTRPNRTCQSESLIPWSSSPSIIARMQSDGRFRARRPESGCAHPKPCSRQVGGPGSHPEGWERTRHGRGTTPASRKTAASPKDAGREGKPPCL